MQTFEDFDEEHAAEQRMQSFWQTGSTANYAAKFQQYAAQTQWRNASLIAQFYRGLKDRVKDDIAQGNQPTQLQKMIIMTVKIDNRQFEQELEKKKTYFFGKGYQDRKGLKRNKYGMVPMEIDATEKRKPFKKKTQKCYNCGKAGHLAKNCSSKKQVNATQEDKRKKKKS